MMNCSKCIHFKRCLHLGTLLRDGMIEEAESFCGDFEVKTDVVAVVRCKNCVNRVQFDTNKFHCELTGYYCGEMGYCSDGVPKERGG